MPPNIRKARKARKELNLLHRVPFTDAPLKEVGEKERTMEVELDPDPDKNQQSDDSMEAEVCSVLTSSEMTGLTGLNLDHMDNQLSVHHCSPTSSELSEAKFIALHKEINAIDGHREADKPVQTTPQIFKKPEHKPLILCKATHGGISSTASILSTCCSCTASQNAHVVRNIILTRDTSGEICFEH